MKYITNVMFKNNLIKCELYRSKQSQVKLFGESIQILFCGWNANQRLVLRNDI